MRLDDQDTTLERWRRAHGRCIRCGGTPLPGQELCLDCASGQAPVGRLPLRQRFMELARRRLAAGLCIKCGKHPVRRDGRRLCTACAAKRRLRRRLRQLDTAPPLPEGVCRRCRRRAAVPGHTLCAECLAYLTRRNGEAAEAARAAAAVGLCTVCRRRPARWGQRTCTECGRTRAERRARVRAKWAAAGRCTECGRPVDPTVHPKICPWCFAKSAKAKRAGFVPPPWPPGSG